MRVVSYNIRFGGGRRIPLLGATIAALEPDVVLLQEATDPHAIDRLAVDAGMATSSSGRAGRSRPLSRAAMRGPRVASPGRRAAASWSSSPPAAALRLIDLHLPAGLSLRGERARLRHVDGLLEGWAAVPTTRTALIGDLNAVAPGDEPRVASMPFWLRLLLRFDGGIRTDVLRRLIDAGWVDAFRHLHPGRGRVHAAARAADPCASTTCWCRRGLLPRIDRCEPADGPLVARASDHLPLLIDVRGPGRPSRRRTPGMTDDRDDLADARSVPGGGLSFRYPRDHAERSARQRR